MVAPARRRQTVHPRSGKWSCGISGSSACRRWFPLGVYWVLGPLHLWRCLDGRRARRLLFAFSREVAAIPAVTWGEAVQWVCQCSYPHVLYSSRVCRCRLGWRQTMISSSGGTNHICWVWMVPPEVMGRGAGWGKAVPFLPIREDDGVCRRGTSIPLALYGCPSRLVVLTLVR